MRKILVFGNSGSGKSTLAKRLADDSKLAHLDLDNIAWQQTSPPSRKPIDESNSLVEQFTARNAAWVVEGCYADLSELLLEKATEVVFLDLPTNLCVENAKQRPWEPHKYKTKEQQDANLSMLIEWIQAYESRVDTFSHTAHQTLFDSFQGKKCRVINNDQSRSFQ